MKMLNMIKNTLNFAKKHFSIEFTPFYRNKFLNITFLDFDFENTEFWLETNLTFMNITIGYLTPKHVRE